MKRVVLFAGVLCSLFLPTVRAAEIDLDFLTGKLNGKDVSSLTVDSVTDILGRPSRTFVSDGTTALYYENAGLCFQSRKNSNQILSIQVYLASKTDDFTLIGGPILHYSAFRGKLPRGTNGNWKLERFLEAFKEQGAIDDSDYTRIRSCRASGVDPGVWCRAKMSLSKITVWAFYQCETKFLDKLSIKMED